MKSYIPRFRLNALANIYMCQNIPLKQQCKMTSLTSNRKVTLFRLQPYSQEIDTRSVFSEREGRWYRFIHPYILAKVSAAPEQDKVHIRLLKVVFLLNIHCFSAITRFIEIVF